MSHHNIAVFSHSELARELHVENVFLRSHPGEIISDAFWTRVEAAYDANHAAFLRAHECPLLDHILKHDKLECVVGPYTPNTDPCEPTKPICHVEPKCGPYAVPEPSGMTLFGIAIIAVFVFFVTLKGK